jgi:prepilin-type N-terminal cleavage/methylation domain-containing protein
MLKLRNVSGFSLTELLITIIIIVVLIGIVVPNYNRIRINADAQKAIANLNAICQAQKYFRADADPAVPQAYTADDVVLRTYVDFSGDDGTWTYQIVFAAADEFEAMAVHNLYPTRIMRIDETGSITRQGF